MDDEYGKQRIPVRQGRPTFPGFCFTICFGMSLAEKAIEELETIDGKMLRQSLGL
ncbi:MAG: hypothetical protein R2861_05945 [Desulfobacterales bacterium]